MEKRRLRENILDQLEAKDLSPQDIARQTGMPEAYVDAILGDKRDKLPAFPYIRSYLLKLAQVLGLDPQQVMDEYRAEFSNKISGIGDTLPANRFALPSRRRRYVVAAGVLCLIILGYAISSSGFFGRPHLVLTMPPAGSADPYVTASSSITLAGQIDAGDKLLINDQDTPVSKEGLFSVDYPLSPELNTIAFTAQRFLGKEVTVTRHVFYQEATSTKPIVHATTTQAISTEAVSSTASSTNN